MPITVTTIRYPTRPHNRCFIILTNYKLNILQGILLLLNLNFKKVTYTNFIKSIFSLLKNNNVLLNKIKFTIKKFNQKIDIILTNHNIH